MPPVNVDELVQQACDETGLDDFGATRVARGPRPARRRARHRGPDQRHRAGGRPRRADDLPEGPARDHRVPRRAPRDRRPSTSSRRSSSSARAAPAPRSCTTSSRWIPRPACRHVGGRPARPAARDRDLRHRPAHRRGRRDARDGRPRAPRLPRDAPDGRAPAAGVRAHHRLRLPLDDLPDAVPRAVVRALVAARDRHGVRVPRGTACSSSTCSRTTRRRGGC